MPREYDFWIYIMANKLDSSWARKKKVALIESMNPRWADLSEDLFGNI